MFDGSGSCLIENKLFTLVSSLTKRKRHPTTDTLVDEMIEKLLTVNSGFRTWVLQCPPISFDLLVDLCGVCSSFCPAEHHVRNGIDVKD